MKHHWSAIINSYYLRTMKRRSYPHLVWCLLYFSSLFLSSIRMAKMGMMNLCRVSVSVKESESVCERENTPIPAQTRAQAELAKTLFFPSPRVPTILLWPFLSNSSPLTFLLLVRSRKTGETRKKNWRNSFQFFPTSGNFTDSEQKIQLVVDRKRSPSIPLSRKQEQKKLPENSGNLNEAFG